jgi:hypothetical protein
LNVVLVAVDAYLVALGALSLLFFFVMCVAPFPVFALCYLLSFNRGILELVRKDGLTTKVWFECAWVAAFMLLQLCVFT